MKRGLLVLILSTFLGGCAMPVGVQVASWAIDGISMIATKKSMTDHGISLVTQQDCALWRVVRQENICVENEDAATAIAAVDDEDDNFDHSAILQTAQLDQIYNKIDGKSPSTPIVTAENSADTPADIAKLANFETAAGAEIKHNVAKTASKPKLFTQYAGYAADTFSAATTELKSRHDGVQIFADLSVKAKTQPEKPISHSADRSIDGIAGYAANEFAAAWAFKKGEAKPKIQWVFVASPAPQQEREFNSETINVASAEPEPEEIHEPADTSDEVTLEKPSNSLKNNIENNENKLIQGNKPLAQTVMPAEVTPQEPQIIPVTQTSETGKPAINVKVPVPGSVYFVIASFDDTESAVPLMKKHRSLDIQLVVGNLDGRPVYRGIVGPFALKDITQAKQRIWRAGVNNPWAVRLDYSKWTFLYSASISEELSLRR
jgi:hypothetical protein